MLLGGRGGVVETRCRERFEETKISGRRRFKDHYPVECGPSVPDGRGTPPPVTPVGAIEVDFGPLRSWTVFLIFTLVTMY